MSDDKDTRARTLRWHVAIDDLAVRLAAARGFSRNGRTMVNEFLEKLVENESKFPRLPLIEPTPDVQEHVRQMDKALREAKELNDALAERRRKKQ